MNKIDVLASLQKTLAAELDLLTKGAQASFEAATDPDSRAENKYDTRTLEASYVARGQAQRVAELQEAVTQYQILAHQLTPCSTVCVGALVTLNDEFVYFFGPSAGGTEVILNGVEVLVITPTAPLGQKLLGKKLGDSVELSAGRPQRITALS
jgi:transcription elongation GreA/GreB family factor